MSEQYFQGIKVGDRIWTIQEGWTEVINVGINGKTYPIDTEQNAYTLSGLWRKDNKHQSAFWSDPGIVAPPRPKRMKKVKVEVRPFQLTNGSFHVAAPNECLVFCGPLQPIEIEVEDD